MVYPRAVMENGINSRIGYSVELCDMWDSIDYYVKIKNKPDDGIYIIYYILLRLHKTFFLS